MIQANQDIEYGTHVCCLTQHKPMWHTPIVLTKQLSACYTSVSREVLPISGLISIRLTNKRRKIKIYEGALLHGNRADHCNNNNLTPTSYRVVI